MKSIFVKIVIIIIAVLFLFYVGRNIIVKTALTSVVKAMTGLELGIEKINIGVFNTLIDVKNLKLYNPAGYPEKVMLDMPELFIDYDLGAILAGKIHIEKMRLNLKEMNVVKNSKGELNLNSLNTVRSQQAKKEGVKTTTAPGAKMPDIRIDSFDLKISKVSYKDYSMGTSPRVRDFNINIDEHFENITDPYALSSIIIVKALQNTIIANLANFDLGPLMPDASKILESATKNVSQAATKILGEGQKALDAGNLNEAGKAAQEAVGNVGKAAGDTANKAIDQIKGILPIGK